MISDSCEDEWQKLDLTIPYPLPPRPFNFSRVPQRAKMFCLLPPDVTPPPPDPMEIERYPTPPPRQQQRTQPSPGTPQPGTDQPLFLPEDDCASRPHDLRPFNLSLRCRVRPQTAKPKIKNLDPYQEGPSVPSQVRAPTDTDTKRSSFNSTVPIITFDISFAPLTSAENLYVLQMKPVLLFSEALPPPLMPRGRASNQKPG